MKEFRPSIPTYAVRTSLIPLLLLVAGSALAELPDLIINRSRLATGLEIREQYFSAADCAVIEGCLKGSGNRRLLLFEVAFVNIGKADLVIGRPEDNPHLFEDSPCHGHHHLEGAASYELVSSDGRSVLVGRKQAFCLRDNAPYSSSAGPSHGYDCDNQGITAGWEDIYPKNLDCQWLDITGVAGGTYTLKVTVNPIRVFQEASYANNTASVTVQIPPKPGTITAPKPKPSPPKLQPTKKAPPPKHLKKPKKSKGKHKGWFKKPVKKPAPKPVPKHDDDDDDAGHDDDDD
jgi:Lysyl oxidase